MKLRSIVLDFSEELLENEMKEFRTRIGKAYQVEACSLKMVGEEFDKELQSFFCEKGLYKSSSLFLSGNREHLLRAREMNLAILACSVLEEDYSGFPLVVEDVWETDEQFLLRTYQREWKQPWEIMRTKRLLIREETEADIDELYEIYESDHIKRFLEPLYEEREKELEYISKYRQYVYSYYEYGLWHLVDLKTGKCVGRAGLNPKTYEDGVCGAELGYMIAKPFLRKGYCLEACGAILTYSKEELGIPEVYCLIRRDNETSIEVAKKLGFTFEKELIEDGREMLRFYKLL